MHVVTTYFMGEEMSSRAMVRAIDRDSKERLQSFDPTSPLGSRMCGITDEDLRDTQAGEIHLHIISEQIRANIPIKYRKHIRKFSIRGVGDPNTWGWEYVPETT